LGVSIFWPCVFFVSFIFPSFIAFVCVSLFQPPALFYVCLFLVIHT
jgi:hypothetical protein